MIIKTQIALLNAAVIIATFTPVYADEGSSQYMSQPPQQQGSSQFGQQPQQGMSQPQVPATSGGNEGAVSDDGGSLRLMPPGYQAPQQQRQIPQPNEANEPPPDSTQVESPNN